LDNADQIRTAATQLFATLGYEGTSLQAIAERVGVTKQTLLYHYPSKDALRRAVLEHVFTHWRQRLPQMLEAVTSGHGRFEALTRELVHFFDADSNRARLLARELLDNPEEMRRLLVDNLKPWLLLVAQYIREGQKTGIIHADLDPEAYVLNVIMLVLSNATVRSLAQSVLGSEARGDAAARQMSELLRFTRTALFKSSRG
jgi:TetR/AcrR family transcriptional regulator